MLVDFIQKSLEQWNLESLVAEESLSQALGCNLNSLIIVNKENPSSMCLECISYIVV